MIYSEVNLEVRYYETDQMGVVHHSNYIRYFECARNNMMLQMGYPIEKCEEDGVFTPIVSVECKYHHPAKMGDILKCIAIVEKAPLAKLFIKQAVYNQDSMLCADGIVVLGFIDKVSGRPVRCPDILLKLIEQHINDKL